MPYKYGLLVLFAWLAINLSGQTSTQFHSWWANINTYGLSDKLEMKSEVHFRRSSFISQWQQFLLRPTLYVKMKGNWKLGSGGSYIENFPYGDQPIALRATEWQWFEDAVLYQQIGKAKLLQRFRLEQRWAAQIQMDQELHPFKAGTTYGNRFRYRLGFSLPLLGDTSKNGLYLTGYDEIFLLLNRQLAVSDANQNWLLLAIGKSVTEHMKIEVGYRNQRILKGDHQHIENNHTLDVALKYDFRSRT